MSATFKEHMKDFYVRCETLAGFEPGSPGRLTKTPTIEATAKHFGLSSTVRNLINKYHVLSRMGHWCFGKDRYNERQTFKSQLWIALTLESVLYITRVIIVPIITIAPIMHWTKVNSIISVVERNVRKHYEDDNTQAGISIVWRSDFLFSLYKYIFYFTSPGHFT